MHEKSINYFTLISQPFADYSTIKELLKQSENASMEVGQVYILNTFDLGGYMKASPLIWKFPNQCQYRNVPHSNELLGYGDWS